MSVFKFLFHFLQLLTRLYYRIMIISNDDADNVCNDSDDTEKKREKGPKRRDNVSWAIGEFFKFLFHFITTN